MGSLNRVLWSEGLLMAPQHLQQQNLYTEELIHRRVSALSRDSWGVVKVSLDERSLIQGQVTIESLRGIMPDGTALDLETLPPRSIENHFPPAQSTLDLYLALPQSRDGISSVSSDRDARIRWYRESRLIHDLLAEADPQDVEFVRPSAILLFGDESREGYDSIKIAEIIRTDGGGYAVSDTYIPPCLRIDSAPFLVSGLRRLLATMTTRRTALSGSLSERDDGTVEFTGRDVTRFLLLSSINTMFPIVDHLAESGDLPPRTLYMVLCQLYGQLAIFSKKHDLSSLPKFVFHDLRSTFEPLFSMITSLLHSTVKEHYVVMGLDSRDDGMHFGQMNEDGFFHCTKYFLAVKTPVDDEEARSQLPRLSKLASWQDINSILSAATPGAPIEVTYRPPAQIPFKSGILYFSVDTNNQFWKNIIAERSVALYLPGAFSPKETSVELFGVLDPKRKSASGDR